ncbi:unnamed protein product [Rotaria socialis]|uniref:Brix domain-containing protein n=1 Tax=Rotaria socialis TaxID=392032 RepID=A0A819ZVU4_9BILA|nr:unnamed protein product [Rotaria socialis]CAF3279542.1 unnamed protein product [Rotaria socialis]CAF3372631.1 unnamed protein product [Rotaria socialis]CAF3488738.1 unnamed protein product [Rotaria socialis]CAF3638992.1 unnamed protein product [Rotaria socialis]
MVRRNKDSASNDDNERPMRRKPFRKSTNEEESPAQVPTGDLQIRNKMVRQLLYAKLKRSKSKAKLKERKERQQSDEPKQEPQTIEKKRKRDETWVDENDQETLDDISNDELNNYFTRQPDAPEPKLLLTSQEGFPSSFTNKFLKEVARILPNTTYFQRRHHPIKRIIKKMNKLGYTDLVVVNEDHGKPSTLFISHLPEGPTMKFRLTSARLSKQLRSNRGKPCAKLTIRPEIILNNFNTRIGIRVGRLLAALFPHDPQYKARHLITFHNQRDFIFFRHHMYLFKNEKKVALQELGPRFTLKLRSIQRGTFDALYGEYEWTQKPKHKMDPERTKFVL